MFKNVVVVLYCQGQVQCCFSIEWLLQIVQKWGILNKCNSCGFSVTCGLFDFLFVSLFVYLKLLSFNSNQRKGVVVERKNLNQVFDERRESWG